MDGKFTEGQFNSLVREVKAAGYLFIMGKHIADQVKAFDKDGKLDITYNSGDRGYTVRLKND